MPERLSPGIDELHSSIRGAGGGNRRFSFDVPRHDGEISGNRLVPPVACRADCIPGRSIPWLQSPTSVKGSNPDMTDTYRSFAELSREMREGGDFEIRLSGGPLPVLVIALHAGRIEPGTGRIARTVAGSDFPCYEFRGIRASDNRRLHLTSHRFDEPRCLAAVRLAHLAVAFHGVRGNDEFIMIGGRAQGLAGMIGEVLAAGGWEVRTAGDGLRGEHPRNICNRGHSGRGIQIEISDGLRKRLVRNPGVLDGFSKAIRGPLLRRFGKMAEHRVPIVG